MNKTIRPTSFPSQVKPWTLTKVAILERLLCNSERCRAHCAVSLRDQAAREFSLSIKHSHSAGYNAPEKVEIGALLYSGTFIPPPLENHVCFHWIAGSVRRVTVPRLWASEYVARPMPAARCDFSAPRLQFQIPFLEAICMARRLLILLGLVFRF